MRGPSRDVREWLAARSAAVDAYISNFLQLLRVQNNSEDSLLRAVEYSIAGGGKRLRPVLVLEACVACGGAEACAWPAALAVEMVHTFSLIHDDLPAMDDDDLRRGRPTNHRVHGEALAILAGDWLAVQPFALIARADLPAATRVALAETLADGTTAMIAGQAADLAGERMPPREELVREIHERKTAALLSACSRMGALSAGASPARVEQLGEYGRRLGLAFQIVDDLLDETASAEHVGKRTGKDASAGKQTYPAVYGVEESRRRAAAEVAAAHDTLTDFGTEADRLRDLAGYVLARDR